MALTNDYPTIRPSLLLDFARSRALDPRITFTRATIATRVNEEGYVETVESGVPRFDFDPVTLASKGLLIEEQRTNLLTYSEDFGNASWDKIQSSVTTNATTAPDNTVTADKLIEASDTNQVHFVRKLLSVTSAATYSASIFVKAAERTRCRIGFIETVTPSGVVADANLSAGTITAASAFGGGTAVSSSISAYPNGWYRITVVGSGAAGTNGEFRLELLDASGNRQYNGDGTSGLFIWGAQLEAGANPTSYIPTTTATVQRNADTCSIQSIGSFFNPSEGALYFKVAPTPQTGASIVQYPAIGFTPAGLDSGKTIQVFKASNTNTWYYLVRTSTGDVVNITYANAALSTAAIAIAYKVNDFAASLNGATALTDTSGDLPLSTELTALNIGSFNSTGRINSTISKIAYYPVRLTNAQLQALTRS